MSKRWLTPVPSIAVALAAILALLVLSGLFIRSMPLSYDEGIHLMFGTLANQGYEPYQEIFIGIPPLGLLITQAGLALFVDPSNVRYLMLWISLMGAFALFWIVRYQAAHNPVWSGLLAGLFLFGFPNYFFQANLVTMDVPALALALLALALVEHYRYRRSPAWLLLSGLVFGLSLATKILVVFLPLLIGLQLVAIVFLDEKSSLRRWSTYGQLIKLGLIWFIGLLVVLLVLLLLYNPADLYHDVIAFRLVDRAVRMADGDSDIQKNIEMLAKAMNQFWPLGIGALLGLWAVGRRGWARLWLWLAWFGLAGIFLFLHVPSRSHHAVILLPPLAALSGIGVTHLPYRFSPPARWLAPLLALVIAGLTFLNLGLGMIPFPRQDDFEANTGRLSAVEFVRQTTGPNDCIIVDDPRAALLSRRKIPPNLAEPSHARVGIGWLPTATIINSAQQDDCQVLMMGPRFSSLPDFEQAAAPIYALKLLFANPDGAHTITVYAVKTDTRAEPAQIFNLPLADQVILKGADVTPAPWLPGQTVSISTYWQAQQKMAQDYKIFMHLKNEAGQTVQTFDHYPFEFDHDYLTTYIMPNPIYWQNGLPPDATHYPATGLLPTRLWLPGQTLKETVNLTLAADLAPGVYTLEVGMYDETTLAPLVVQGEPPAGGQVGVIVATVEVSE